MQILLSRRAQLDNGTVLLAGVYNVVSLSLFPSQWPPKLSAPVSQDFDFSHHGQHNLLTHCQYLQAISFINKLYYLGADRAKVTILIISKPFPMNPEAMETEMVEFMSSVSKAIQGKTVSNSHFSLQCQKNWAYFYQWPIMLHKFAWGELYMCKMHMRRQSTGRGPSLISLPDRMLCSSPLEAFRSCMSLTQPGSHLMTYPLDVQPSHPRVSNCKNIFIIKQGPLSRTTTKEQSCSNASIQLYLKRSTLPLEL